MREGGREGGREVKSSQKRNQVLIRKPRGFVWVGGETFIYVDLHVTSVCVSKYFRKPDCIKVTL